MNHQGFTLIELLVSLAIAAVFSVLLFQALFQANFSLNAGDTIMTINTKAMQLRQLLERDLSGATILADNEEKPKETEMITPKAEEPAGQKAPTPAKKGPEGGKEKKEKPIIKKIFFSSAKGTGLGVLTFISNNPLMSFWSTYKGSSEKGKAKPYLARITYELEDDKNNPGALILKRQESSVLDWEKRSGRTYEVIDGIKSITVEFVEKTEKIIPVKNEKAEKATTTGATQVPAQAPKKKQPKVETTYKTVQLWDTDQIRDKELKKQKSKEKTAKDEIIEKTKLIPVLVRFKVIFFDKDQKQEQKFDFVFSIITDTEFIPKKKPSLFAAFFGQQQPPKPEQPSQQQQSQHSKI